MICYGRPPRRLYRRGEGPPAVPTCCRRRFCFKEFNSDYIPGVPFVKSCPIGLRLPVSMCGIIPQSRSEISEMMASASDSEVSPP